MVVGREEERPHTYREQLAGLCEFMKARVRVDVRPHAPTLSSRTHPPTHLEQRVAHGLDAKHPPTHLEQRITHGLDAQHVDDLDEVVADGARVVDAGVGQALGGRGE